MALIGYSVTCGNFTREHGAKGFNLLFNHYLLIYRLQDVKFSFLTVALFADIGFFYESVKP